MLFFLLIAAWPLGSSAMCFVPYRPGLIPNLDAQVSPPTMDGGYIRADLNDPDDRAYVEQMIRSALTDLQEKNPTTDAEPHTVLVKVKTAIRQIQGGAGENHKMVFLAKQTNPFSTTTDGPFGICYFEIFEPRKRNVALEVETFVCAEIPEGEGT